MRSSIIRAAIAAAAIAGASPVMAQTITYADGGNMAYTSTSLATSTAPGVTALSLSGIGQIAATGGATSTWTNSQMSVTAVLNPAWAAGAKLNSTITEPTNLSGGFQTVSGTTALLYAADSPCCYNPSASPYVAMTLDTPQSYFGAVVDVSAPYSGTLSFYSGSTLLATIGESTIGQLDSSGGGIGGTSSVALRAMYLNVDFLDGQTFNSIVVSQPANVSGDDNQIAIGFMVAATSPVSLTNLTSSSPLPSPMPALAGTVPGLLAAVTGLVGLRRRRAA